MENIEQILKEIKDRRIQRAIRMDIDWKETLHPRDKSGKFTSGSGSSGGSSSETSKKAVSKASASKASKPSGPTRAKGNSRLSNTTKTKSGTSYPALKRGAHYSTALDIAEKTALEDEGNGWIPKGTWESVVKNLKPSDVVYQKNEDGKDVACIPGLAAMVDKQIKGSPKMKKVFADALKDEKEMTPHVIQAAKDSGMYLDGLENSAKGASHIEDKAERKLSDFRKEKMADASVDDVAANFGDMVRYTAITDNDHLIEGVGKLKDSLEKQGYKVTEIDNKFLNKDGTVNNNGTYRAIHLTAETPSGRNVEIQVHSKETLAVKDINHEIYEKQRELEKVDKEKWTDEMKQKNDEYNAEMVKNWHKHYTNPEGIDALKSYDHRNKTLKRA